MRITCVWSPLYHLWKQLLVFENIIGLFCKLLLWQISRCLPFRRIEYFDNQPGVEKIKPSNEEERNTLEVVTCNMQVTLLRWQLWLSVAI